MPPRAPRLAITKRTLLRDWDDAALTADGRLLTQRWNYQRADTYALDGTPLKLPYESERKLRASGDQIVWVGHGFGDTSPATILVQTGAKQRRFSVARPHERHVLDARLDGDSLWLVLSDPFAVGTGTAIQEVSLRGAKATAGPVRAIPAFERHARVTAILPGGGRVLALAATARKVSALLDVSGTRPHVIAKLAAHTAVFDAEGAHVVIQNKNDITWLALDGTKRARLTVTAPARSYIDLVAARSGEVVLRVNRPQFKRDLMVVRTAASPSARGAASSARAA